MKGFTENDMILIGKLAELGLYFKIGVHEVKVSDGDNVKVSFPISEGQNLFASFMAELKRAEKEDSYARKLYYSLSFELNRPIAEVKENEKVLIDKDKLKEILSDIDHKGYGEYYLNHTVLPTDTESLAFGFLEFIQKAKKEEKPQMTPNCIPTPIWELLQETSKSATTTTEQIKNNRIKNAIQNLKNELDNYTKGN
jgi:hypothetical protein